MFSYIGIVISALYYLDIWASSHLTTTVFWSTSVAFVALFRVNSIIHDEHYFRNAVVDQLKLVAVFDFLVNFNVFNIWTELILVPVITYLVVLSAVAESRTEFKTTKKLLDWVLAVFGLVLVTIALVETVRHLDTFASLSTLKDFVLPPLMTLLFLPFVYAFGLFVSYQNLFVRLHFFVKDDELVRFAKLRVLLAFHVRLNLINKWGKHINTLQMLSEDDVRMAINSFLSSHYGKEQA